MVLKPALSNNGALKTLLLNQKNWAGRSVEDRLLCKQKAMGSNPIRSIGLFRIGD